MLGLLITYKILSDTITWKLIRLKVTMCSFIPPNKTIKQSK